VELAVQGFTYEAIGAKIGIAHRGTVHRMVHQAIKERAARGVEELRRVNYDRLEALILTLWPEVERGDIEAIAAALRVIPQKSGSSNLTTSRSGQLEGPKLWFNLIWRQPRPEGRSATSLPATVAERRGVAQPRAAAGLTLIMQDRSACRGG